MVTNVGILGVSVGNGHPYSFSAIINGYDRDAFSICGWPVINNYLESKDKTEFGIDGLRVRCIWTQDLEESYKIARATNIDVVCRTVDEMVTQVQAVIIARDDWECHYPLALKFLNEGKYVFIDKPLSLNTHEIREFIPYIDEGKLMSCAALRYAVEFDAYRFACRENRPKFIIGSIVSDWQRYGVHLLDGIFSGISFNVESVFASGDLPMVAILNCSDGTKIVINCLGRTEKTFNLVSYFENKKIICDMSDNFTAFKRTLSHFKQMILGYEIPVPSELTVNIMKTLIAGEISYKEKRLVYLDEIEI